MKIKMLGTHRGSEDGFIVKQYHKDLIYDVADMLARSFIRHGWAVEVVGDEPLVTDWSNPGSMTKEQIGADIARVMERVMRPVATNPQTHKDRGEPL